MHQRYTAIRTELVRKRDYVRSLLECALLRLLEGRIGKGIDQPMGDDDQKIIANRLWFKEQLGLLSTLDLIEQLNHNNSNVIRDTVEISFLYLLPYGKRKCKGGKRDRNLSNEELLYRYRTMIEGGWTITQIAGHLVKKVFHLLIAIYDTLYCRGMIQKFTHVGKDFTLLLSYALKGELEKWYKTVTTRMFNTCTKQTEPVEGPAYSQRILTGGLGRLLYLLSKRTTSRVFMREICLCKRAGEPLSYGHLKEFITKHQKIMASTEIRQIPMHDIGGRTTKLSIHVIRDLIKDKITSIVDRKFRNLGEPEYRVPSVGSSYESTRKDLGTMGYLRALIKKPMMVRKEFVGYVRYGREVKPVYVDEDLSDVYYKLLEEDVLNCTPNPIVARIHTVMEPFKARIISAGESSRYHFSREIQKLVHNRLRSIPMFKLTGEPHTAEAMSHFRGMKIPKDWFFVSGDYDAATDGIDPEFSLHTAEKLYSHLSFSGLDKAWIYYRSYIDSMSSHLLDYGGDFLLKQTFGQLMGSPSSFPILCIINAACISVAMDLTKNINTTTIDDLYEQNGVLINGDDIVFLSDKTLYHNWRFVSQCAGLLPSVGKNAIGHDWFDINSTMFEVKRSPVHIDLMDLGLKLYEFDEVKCVSLSRVLYPNLLQCRSKVQSDSRRTTMGEKPLGDVFKKSVVGGTAGSNELDCFLWHNLGTMLQTKRSWTLPPCFGGYGLPIDRPLTVFENRMVQYCTKFQIVPPSSEERYVLDNTECSPYRKEYLKNNNNNKKTTDGYPDLNKMKLSSGYKQIKSPYRTFLQEMLQDRRFTTIKPMSSLNVDQWDYRLRYSVLR